MMNYSALLTGLPISITLQPLLSLVYLIVDETNKLIELYCDKKDDIKESILLPEYHTILNNAIKDRIKIFNIYTDSIDDIITKYLISDDIYNIFLYSLNLYKDNEYNDDTPSSIYDFDLVLNKNSNLLHENSTGKLKTILNSSIYNTIDTLTFCSKNDKIYTFNAKIFKKPPKHHSITWFLPQIIDNTVIDETITNKQNNIYDEQDTTLNDIIKDINIPYNRKLFLMGESKTPSTWFSQLIHLFL